MAHVSTYHVSQKLLKIAARNVSKIRFVASTSPGDEGRGRKVRYRSLFRAGPWAAVVLISRVRRGWREGEKERERERERKKWKEVHAMSRVLVGQRCKGKFLGQKWSRTGFVRRRQSS